MTSVSILEQDLSKAKLSGEGHGFSDGGSFSTPNPGLVYDVDVSDFPG